MGKFVTSVFYRGQREQLARQTAELERSESIYSDISENIELSSDANLIPTNDRQSERDSPQTSMRRDEINVLETFIDEKFAETVKPPPSKHETSQERQRTAATGGSSQNTASKNNARKGKKKNKKKERENHEKSSTTVDDDEQDTRELRRSRSLDSIPQRTILSFLQASGQQTPISESKKRTTSPPDRPGSKRSDTGESNKK
ncbi:uncharacterized protein [Ptychodera flava]|uniref:uncharacterized protein n=1 Tax=Ptychodera flava TaxID=63121 RepID=UPI00396A6771